MKYYYTDPLKAAWMAKHFNFKFFEIYSPHPDISEDQKIHQDFNNEFFPLIIASYIHPDCHEMLKPQIGDLIKPIGGYNTETFLYVDKFVDCEFECNSLGGKVPSSSYSGTDYLDSNHELPENERVSGFEIIQRNGKAFFMPEMEII